MRHMLNEHNMIHMIQSWESEDSPCNTEECQMVAATTEATDEWERQGKVL